MFGKENKKTNKKISLYLSFTIIMLFFMYEIFCGVRIFIAKANMISIDCSSGFEVQKGDYIEANVMCATKEYVEVKHSVNFIPTGKEHYYLLISKDLKSCISIRADKEWYDEHFIKSAAIDPAGIKVKGYVKKWIIKSKKKCKKSSMIIQTKV